MSNSSTVHSVHDGVNQTYRTVAVILALIVIMGLGYGLVDTTIKAAALFTE